MTYEDALCVLADVSYKDGWNFDLQCRDGDWYLRLSCTVLDSYDHRTERIAYGRWWHIPYKTKGDVVRTAFIACLTMEEHECREAFAYKKLPVFGPHLDLDLLVEQAEQREHQPDFQTEIVKR